MNPIRKIKFSIGGPAKRVFDLVVTGFLVVVLSPVFVALALLVWLLLGRPIIFKQQRPGLHGEPFTIHKFRSMRDVADRNGEPVSDEHRLTRFGRIIRAASLDELPELWNVIRGDMSLVGPRPLMMRYLPRYSPEQARRHDVKPGVTGLAQIGGRNALSWDEKFALDLEYVDNHTLWLDVSILFRTLGKVFSREGISHRDHTTMPDFSGNDDASSS